MGPNLQALVNGNCINSEAAGGLSDTQKAAIENLTQAQIATLIQVQAAVGEIYGAKMI
jgi:hypothetical protein